MPDIIVTNQTNNFFCKDFGPPLRHTDIAGLEPEKKPVMQPEPPQASEVFAKEVISLIGHNDVWHILDMQGDIKESLVASTETLVKMNELSKQEYNKIEEDFEKHTRMMKEMKSDLDYIFQKIKFIRTKLDQHCPEAFIPEDQGF